MNLATETNGKCKICCVVMTNKYIQKDNGEDYLIQKDDISEIWNSNYVKDVRKKILKGQWPSDCFYCHQQERLGNSSPRKDYNRRWWSKKINDRVEESKASGGHVEELPISLEPRPGITCNLKCNMCWSMSSSKVYSERKKALEDPETPQFLKDSWRYEIEQAGISDFKWANSPVYLQNMEKCLNNLKRLYFTGGEPTLIKSNILLLQNLLKENRRDLLVSYTTNLNYETSQLVDLSFEFSHLEITGSIDALGAANDYIRYPSQWRLIEKNLENIFEKKAYYSWRRIGFAIMSVYQLCNVFSFLDLVEWLAEQPKYRDISIFATLLQGPDYLRPEILPEHLKSKVFSRIDDLLKKPELNEQNRRTLNELKSQLKVVRPDQDKLLKQFSQYIVHLDSLRKTSFKETFPELAELIKD